jgi:hypothetical protein
VVYVQPPDQPPAAARKYVPTAVGIARAAVPKRESNDGAWFFGLRLDAMLPGYLAGTMR